MWCLFCHCLFLVSLSVGSPGRLFFVIVAIREYPHLYFFQGGGGGVGAGDGAEMGKVMYTPLNPSFTI